jgi:lipoyl(octanoyl) transferase
LHADLKLLVRSLGLQDYSQTWQAMRDFTDGRGAETADELWLLEHHPVYTLGRNGDPSHILRANGIPVVESDRGGQVTYHGPGQLVAYTLFDLQRLGIGVKSLVHGLERAVVRTLAGYGIQSEPREDAPGVYVAGAKIASLGLRVRNGRSFHGLSLNVAMDLAPFEAINPCGYPGLAVTQMSDLGVEVGLEEVALSVIDQVGREFGYREVGGI